MGDSQKVIDLIEPAERVLILTHARPDGDALGSALGLQLSLLAAGKQADFALLTPAPSKYDFLVALYAPLAAWERRVDLARYDCTVILDTCAYSQLDGLGDQLDEHRSRIAVVDHHTTCDPIGRVQWIDVDSSACGAMIYRLIHQAGWPFNREIAEALFVALATDTGWFRFANTNAEALRLAAELVDTGLDVDALYQRIYQNDPPQRVALAAEMLRSLELHAGGRLALVRITQEMYARTGADPTDTEGLIDLPQVIGSVIVTVLMAERPGGAGARLSFRSKGEVDVDAIARQFGGGGHVRAAGAKVPGETFETLTPKVIAACERALASDRPPERGSIC